MSRRTPLPALRSPWLCGLVLLLACTGGNERPRPIDRRAPGPEPVAPRTEPAPPNPVPAPSPAAEGGESTSPPAAVVEPLPPELLPAPEPAAPPRPAEPLPAPPVVDLATALRIRVGLASDLGTVTLPCCDGEITLAAVEGSLPTGSALPAGTPLVSPIRVEPLVAGRPQVWRLQVAALKDEERARALAEKLGRDNSLPADAHFDAGVDLFRVRLGRFPSREAAQIAARRISPGASESWIVSEGAEMQDPALRVSQSGKTFTVPGRWLAVQASPGGGIRVDGHRYRDRVLVYLNDRGSLNVINELPLEDYLRGVVPKEMGPEAYPRLEALKAQAVAARTYALRNQAGFLAEGYDICATPHCQVYGGMDVEHPRSDQAVAETEAQVLLWDGQPVEALYTATCGGHTEDVEVVFPGQTEPYLRGVPCIEAGVTRLAGRAAAGAPLASGLTQLLLPGTAHDAPAVAARLGRLAELAGLPAPGDHLRSLDRREVQRFLLSLFDLALDVSLFVPREDLAYLVPQVPAGWSEEDRRRAAYLAANDLLTGPLTTAPTAGEIDHLLLQLAERLQVLAQREARFAEVKGGKLAVNDAGGSHSWALSSRLLTFRLQGEQPTAGDLALVPGDRLTLYVQNDDLVAVVQEVDPRGIAYDRSAKLATWSRFRSDGELAARVEERYPGLGFHGLEVLDRGRSGRVARLRLLGRAGSEEVRGLAVRWLLDLPETLFTMQRVKPAKGKAGWVFAGKGWGHGVGLCQTGAFGMAGRGASYRQILAHYYSGAQLARARPNR